MVVLTIALGIGSNAAVYGFVRGFVTPDLDITDLDRVVSLFTRDTQRNLTPLSYERFQELARNADLFERLGAARESRIRVTAGPRTLTLAAAAITPEAGDILGLPAGKGVVISDRLRRGELGTLRDFSEVRLHVDGLELPVGGVAPPSVEGLYSGRIVDVWLPLEDETIRGLDRLSPTFTVLGRLRAVASVYVAKLSFSAVAGEDPIAMYHFT